MPDRLVRMTIAVLSDIHGNRRALEAVLAEPDVQSANTVLIAGDAVPGPHAAEVMTLLRDLGSRLQTVRGDGERAVAQALLTTTPQHDDMYVWTKRRLDIRDISRIADLPIVVELEGTLICHATPTRDDQAFTLDTPDHEVLTAVSPVTQGTLIVAHTHQQFDRTVGDVRILNAGSVGLPNEGSPGARWALIDGPQVFLNTTSYDHLAEADEWQRTDFPNAERWASILRAPEQARSAT